MYLNITRISFCNIPLDLNSLHGYSVLVKRVLEHFHGFRNIFHGQYGKGDRKENRLCGILTLKDIV